MKDRREIEYRRSISLPQIEHDLMSTYIIIPNYKFHIQQMAILPLVHQSRGGRVVDGIDSPSPLSCNRANKRGESCNRMPSFKLDYSTLDLFHHDRQQTRYSIVLLKGIEIFGAYHNREWQEEKDGCRTKELMNILVGLTYLMLAMRM